MTGRFTVVSERGERVFRQGDAAVLWRMARGEEDDRCARVRVAVCAAVLRAGLYAGPCGAAVAGVIYALEYMERGIAVWFWITLLGVGFVGLLYTFRLTQRRVRLERRAKERQEKKKSRRQKR